MSHQHQACCRDYVLRRCRRWGGGGGSIMSAVYLIDIRHVVRTVYEYGKDIAVFCCCFFVVFNEAIMVKYFKNIKGKTG